MADEKTDRARTRVLHPERDAAALKALTHPLRIRLLGLLREDGPATATELAERTGESSASTSYHLRVLARHGFVAEAGNRDGRERRWRSVHTDTAWDNAAMYASPAGRTSLSAVRGLQIEHLARTLHRHEEDLAAGRLGPQWLEPSGISDRLDRLTPESLTELWETLRRKADELAARDEGDPRAEKTVLLWAGLPLAAGRPGAPGSGTETDTETGTDADGEAAGGDDRPGAHRRNGTA
ncbi:helix-turn-helix domain-containing protein [Streptomyces sp. TRM 70361]|uniref:helix-turn-helix domain-containing protein n=1 Tax=Streptomyces sp. TRM 70361 TaxID=3116553 RepID=UPI002E7B83E9|nr:helix-turn-helix domain-containing protein [Streptomyces sp. TRM 70361]MEE1940863.1 helix-turn-helix domain-containing protein [Streptomyces sp. TRM 70361]